MALATSDKKETRRPSPARGKWVQALTTSVGSKFLMAFTGLGLMGFVIAHLVGNLQVFEGQDAINTYAETLRKSPALLWMARGGLLATFLLHLVEAIHLKRLNRNARPVGYVHEDTTRASFASRTMLLTGLVVLAFIVYHLAHFTFGVTHPDHFGMKDALGRKDVYSMVVFGFRNPWVTLSYIIAQVFLFLHLSHGASSWAHSLGLRHPKFDRLIYYAGLGLSLLIFVGNVSIPLAIVTRLYPVGGTP